MTKLRSQVECLDGHPAVVIASREENRVVISICLRKETTEPPIRAEYLDAVAFDDEGIPLPLLERLCSGNLPEVGTTGLTASARFVFALKTEQLDSSMQAF